MLAKNWEIDDGNIMYATPPSSLCLSPNPYKRRGFVQPKSTAPTQKFQPGVNCSSKGTTGMRPLPLCVPSDSSCHGSALAKAYTTPGDSHTNHQTCASRGSHLREPYRGSQASSGSTSPHKRPWYPAGSRGSPASSRSTSPQKRPWYPAASRGSPASSRSASPHKRPWYPAGCRASPGESGRSDRDGQENTYVVHPNFRHLFTETANAGDAGGALGQNHGGIGVDFDGGDMLQRGPSPPTAANVPQRSETNKKARPATRESRERANAHVPTKKNNLADRQSQHKLAGSVSGRTRNNHQMSPRRFGSQQPCGDKRDGRRHDIDRGSVDMVRDRVRGLQSKEKARSRKNGSSADDRRRARPMPLSSAVFIGHSEQVLALAQHEDVLFSAAADGTAKAWDIYSHQCLATYTGHRKAVWGMQVSKRTLITGSADGTVRFWDIETAQPLHVIDLHSAVRDVVIVGGFLAVATANPSIEVISLSRMKPHATLGGHIMAVSALASLEGDTRVVSGSHDTFIRVWDPDTGNCEAVLSGHGGTIGALSTISGRPPARTRSDGGAYRGGETDSSGEPLIISGSGDSTVRVWGRVGDGSYLGEWACRAVLDGHRHGVWAVHGLSVSGGVFATGAGDATVKIWAPNTSIAEANGMVMDGRGNIESGQHQHHQKWECVGGVRGAAGAVGAVLMSQQALVFGTSEALIARFPLHCCMPKRRPA